MAETNANIPDFFWAQDGNYLFLKIGLVAPENVKAKVTDDTFQFSATHEKIKYELKFNFRFPVVANNTRTKVTRFAEYVIEKETRDAAWSHLIAKSEIRMFKNRCKVDWDRWIDEDDIEESKLNMDFTQFSKLNEEGKKKGAGAEKSEKKEKIDSDDEPLEDLDAVVNQYLKI